MRVTLIDTDAIWAWGPRMLSAVLKQSGHQTRLLLLTSAKSRYTPNELRALDSLVVDSAFIGISCHSIGSDKARQVLEYLKPFGILTVWGGIHATLNPEECTSYADLVCVGEGEGMIADLVSRLEQHQDWRDVPNVAYREKDKFVCNPLRPLIRIDDLPLPDFSCADEFHLLNQRLVRKMRMSEFAKEEIPFLASRGCAFRCTYCCNGKLRQTYAGKGSYVRKSSISQCIERVASLRERYFPESKYIFFVDDDFLDRRTDELREFAENFPKRVGVPFDCQVSPLRVNEERVELLVQAGAWRIRMGVESGSERTKREVYDRPMPNDAVVRASEILSRYPNLVRLYYFIMGNPFEQREDLLETIRLILRLPPPFRVMPFNLVFFPGSLLYERAVSAGLISGKHDSNYEQSYRGGLRYEAHSWKRQNLYLNTLLFMMEGKATRFRLGSLPRFLLPWLIHPSFLGINERYTALTRSMITFKRHTLFLRDWVATIIKRVLGHRKEPLHNPGLFLKTRMQKLFGGAES